MKVTRSMYWGGLVMVAVVVMTAVSDPASAQTKMGGTGSVMGQGGAFSGQSMGGMLKAGEVDAAPFKLMTPAGSVPADGWPKFEHGDLMLSFGAPAPVVPLVSEEKVQWGWDLATFRMKKLRDRKVLYVYELMDRMTAEMVLSAVQTTVRAAWKSDKKAIWTAFGVEYDIAKFKTIGNPKLYSRAAVPIKFDDATFKFLKQEHEPEVFAAAVGAATKGLPSGAFANFTALTAWSAMAKDLKVKLRDLNGRKMKLESAYLKNAWQGPFAWEKLKPLTSFIAVDRDLDIEGVKPLRILISERAWEAMAK